MNSPRKKTSDIEMGTDTEHQGTGYSDNEDTNTADSDFFVSSDSQDSDMGTADTENQGTEDLDDEDTNTADFDTVDSNLTHSCEWLLGSSNSEDSDIEDFNTEDFDFEDSGAANFNTTENAKTEDPTSNPSPETELQRLERTTLPDFECAEDFHRFIFTRINTYQPGVPDEQTYFSRLNKYKGLLEKYGDWTNDEDRAAAAAAAGDSAHRLMALLDEIMLSYI